LKKLIDQFGRVHNYLRISLTDRCNLNCIYCNPAHLQIKITDRSEILSFDEIHRLIGIFVKECGITKIRFTGGEPFVRKGIMDFFNQLSPLIKEYGVQTGLTTNGTLLKNKLYLLKESGIDRLNVSLDSLKKDNFKRITNSDSFENIISAIDTGKRIFEKLKVNTVIIRGINDDEILDFVQFGIDRSINIRFIEFMPFADNRWNESSFISYGEMIEQIGKKFNLIKIENDNLVSKDYKVEGRDGVISFISSVSDHFCGSCNRLRITASGKMKLCLFSQTEEGLDLKELLRDNSINDMDIANIIETEMGNKLFKHPEISELIQLDQNDMISIGG
jgi:molybdenum cofactor biosynthesis protein A